MAAVITGLEAVPQGSISRDRGVVAVDGSWAITSAGRGFCGHGCTVTLVGRLITLTGSDVAVIGQRVPGVGGGIAAVGELVALLRDLTQPAGITQCLLLRVVELLLFST
ncbi:hypothetical protein OG218_01165 [Kineococcus sp. NBC_00420]|uniref:hypothetical protein n=1 Tax=Kineococcus sp. NBC_00420 TaxID=2903564 RepID=UPI002E203274